MNKKTSKPVTIRNMPVELWQKVRAKAILEGRSTREVVIELFEQYIKRED